MQEGRGLVTFIAVSVLQNVVWPHGTNTYSIVNCPSIGVRDRGAVYVYLTGLE